jgi:hypothetical protein
MDSLRQKQNMEILDVFRDLNSQIVGLQNRQVQQFPETLKAKSQRDLGAEVNTDKAIENINKTLESKLGSLEFVVQNINPENRGAQAQEELTTQANRTTFYTSLSQVNNTGDVVPLWNSIVRAYQGGVNRETQQMIKVKVLELLPNLEAINYGINQAIDTIFERKIVRGSFAGTILELLRTLSIFNEIKSQVDSNPPRFELLSVDLLDRSFKNIFESQSSDRLTILKEYAPRGLLTSSTIRNIPDFKTGDVSQRLRQIEEEMGFKIPDSQRSQFEDRLKGVSGVDLTNALSEIRSNMPRVNALNQNAKRLIKQAEDVFDFQTDLFIDYSEAEERLKQIVDEIEVLEGVMPLIDQNLAPEVELPVEPQRPNTLEYYNPLTGEFEMKSYDEDMDEYAKRKEDYDNDYFVYREVEAHNELIRNYQKEEAGRQQAIIDLKREYGILQDAKDNLQNRMSEAEDQEQSIRKQASEQRFDIAPIINKLFNKGQKLHATNKATARRQRDLPEVKEDRDPLEFFRLPGRMPSGYEDNEEKYPEGSGKPNRLLFNDKKNDNYYIH